MTKSTEIELIDFDDAAEFDTEALAEKKVKLILQTPSGKDMTFSYKGENDEKIIESQFMMMLSDQSKRYKDAKSKLINQSTNKNQKYNEDDDIQKTSDLVSSVITEVKVVYDKKLVHIYNDDGKNSRRISELLVNSVEFREQAVEVLNNRSEYLGNSENS